jgi:hypothetical protein
MTSRDAEALQVERDVGHPAELLDELTAVIQSNGIIRFSDIQERWLTLMWAIDAYRIAQVPPRNMGKPDLPPAKRLEGVYRSKGNWFATVLSLLLQNRTEQVILPRVKVHGFSQMHQIDLAWPGRDEDPLVCVETKVTGAPPTPRNPSRGAMSDFSNRRKELKFAATDLKLFRRQDETRIEHWGQWRENAPPKTYFLWAARMRTDTQKANDNIEKLVAEAQTLVNTYLDGAGLIAWEARSGGGYQPVPLPTQARVSTLDDVLHRIASEIRTRVGSGTQPPPPVLPAKRAVQVSELPPDEDYGGRRVRE